MRRRRASTRPRNRGRVRALAPHRVIGEGVMPFVLFLLSVATLVAVSSKSNAKGRPSGGHTTTFTLDANMPDALRNQVLAALVSGADPATLDAFATAIQAQYPLSAGLLHAKAATLRA